jgi:SAM-dependent methyltransferase
MSHATALTPLVNAASAYYRTAGRFALRFARAKLAHDPVFALILAQGLLAGRARLLDPGCGQGLLAAWLLAAHACHARAAPGGWPAGWPAPSLLEAYTGIEINPSEVARARRAFALDPGAAVQVVHGDIRDADFPPADAVVIVDVLHYLDYTAQERVLRRVRAALLPHGLLLLRIADATGGAGFVLGKALDRTVVLLRRRRWQALHCRALGDWQALLSRCGFRACALPMAGGAPFVNVLLRAEVA